VAAVEVHAAAPGAAPAAAVEVQAAAVAAPAAPGTAPAAPVEVQAAPEPARAAVPSPALARTPAAVWVTLEDPQVRLSLP
jgi:hypothetical protein